MKNMEDGMIDFVAEQVERINDKLNEIDERFAFFEGFFYSRCGKTNEYNEWLKNLKEKLEKDKWGE